MIGNVLITTLGSEKTVRTTTQATSSGQLVAQSIDKGVRNANWISSPPYLAGGEYFLAVRTASGTAVVSYSCTAWFISSTGSAYVRTSPTAIAKPTGGNVTGWTLLAYGIERAGTADILSVSGKQVTITFEVDAGDAPNVLISTSALSRQTGAHRAVDRKPVQVTVLQHRLDGPCHETRPTRHSLMAVIGIGAVTAIVGISVGAMTIGALTYTNSNRSSVQARAAAEAGVNAALAGLQPQATAP